MLISRPFELRPPVSRPLFSWLQLRPFLSATFHRHIKLLPLLILVAAEEKSHPSRGRRCQHIRSKKTSEVLRRSGHVRVCCVSYKNNLLSRRGSCPAATNVCVRTQIWKSEGPLTFDLSQLSECLHRVFLPSATTAFNHCGGAAGTGRSL